MGNVRYSPVVISYYYSQATGGLLTRGSTSPSRRSCRTTSALAWGTARRNSTMCVESKQTRVKHGLPLRKDECGPGPRTSPRPWTLSRWLYPSRPWPSCGTAILEYSSETCCSPWRLGSTTRARPPWPRQCGPDRSSSINKRMTCKASQVQPPRSAGLLYKTNSTKNLINRSLSENCLVSIPNTDLLRCPPHAGVDEEICGTISKGYLG